MKAAAVQKAMKAMKAMKAVKAMKAGAMKARKAMSAKKTTTEPEGIAGMRRCLQAQRTVFLEDGKPLKAMTTNHVLLPSMKAPGRGRWKKDASDGKKRQVSMKASVAMKAPAANATCEMKEPAPMEAIAATFDKLTGAATKRELMLRSAYEDEIKVRELLILQLQGMVRRYESLVQCYQISRVPVADCLH